MTAFVQVVATWPNGTITHDVHRHADPTATRDSLIRIYRHVMPHGDDWWDGDTLVRHRCDHGMTADQCRPVVEHITFHATDPRQETAA